MSLLGEKVATAKFKSTRLIRNLKPAYHSRFHDFTVWLHSNIMWNREITGYPMLSETYIYSYETAAHLTIFSVLEALCSWIGCTSFSSCGLQYGRYGDLLTKFKSGKPSIQRIRRGSENTWVPRLDHLVKSRKLKLNSPHKYVTEQVLAS